MQELCVGNQVSRVRMTRGELLSPVCSRPGMPGKQIAASQFQLTVGQINSAGGSGSQLGVGLEQHRACLTVRCRAGPLQVGGQPSA